MFPKPPHSALIALATAAVHHVHLASDAVAKLLAVNFTPEALDAVHTITGLAFYCALTIWSAQMLRRGAILTLAASDLLARGTDALLIWLRQRAIAGLKWATRILDKDGEP